MTPRSPVAQNFIDTEVGAALSRVEGSSAGTRFQIPAAMPTSR
jgi:hypothetical protein